MPELAIAGGKPVRTKPFHSWPIFDERDIEALTRVVKSGKWGCTKGEEVRKFEKQFAEFCGAKHAICLTNGTAALEVALRAIDIEPGDEVIVPPYTFIATASSVAMLGALPVFVDIQPDTLNIDPEKIEEAISERTKAIIPVHIGGRPAEMDAIMEIARKHNLRVIEDCCQAHGAEWRGKKVGTFGDAGAFSFQASKNINAGEGGAIVTNDDDLYLRCYSIVNVGRVPGGEWYQHEYLGSNYRMTEFQGALLQVQMSRWEEQAKRREKNAAYLISLLKDIDGISTLKEDERVTRNAWSSFRLRYHSESFGGKPKSRFLQALSAEGVPMSAGYTPLYRSGLFMRFSKYLKEKNYFGGRPIDYTAISLPAVEKACNEEAIGFPQRYLLGSKEDMDDIARAIRKIRDNHHEL